jgi:hypothetical protein
MRLRAALTGAFILQTAIAACAASPIGGPSDSSRGTTEPTPGRPTAAPAASPAPSDSPLACATSFAGWESWKRVNPVPIEGHEASVTIYVDGVAETAHLEAASPMPTCARIVKASHASAATDAVDGLTVMVKMPAGYDPQRGDWWYGKYDPTGTTAEWQGRVDVCIACHQQAADRDYVFAREVLAATAQ